MQMPSGTLGYFYVEDGIGLRQSVGLTVEQGRKIKPRQGAPELHRGSGPRPPRY
ncbi:hypothetical protein ACIA74_43165 [Streptomyces sp. NPDC051658]|uniref:hypothetical protein n=1 Tax=Streptomyces sp. NPDC051658 TaxID=3365667 RepID=UPI0037A90F3D